MEIQAGAYSGKLEAAEVEDTGASHSDRTGLFPHGFFLQRELYRKTTLELSMLRLTSYSKF